MKRWIWCAALALLLMAVPISDAVAQDEEEVGPAVFLTVGVENPSGETASEGDMLLRAGGGLEWPGMFGDPSYWFFMDYNKVGWGDGEVPDVSRWHYGVKTYFPGYLSNLNPYLCLGVEHRGPDFIVNQRNVTWLALGAEPSFAGGWFHFALESSGWMMEDDQAWRLVIDLVPSNLQ